MAALDWILLAVLLLSLALGAWRGLVYEVLSLAGPGFRDFTRIAAGDPKMWRDVLLANSEQVLAQSRQFQQALQQLECLIQAGDGQGLEDHLTLASAARAHWRMGVPRR